jgi:hypothetical protein
MRKCGPLAELLTSGQVSLYNVPGPDGAPRALPKRAQKHPSRPAVLKCTHISEHLLLEDHLIWIGGTDLALMASV